MASVPKRDRAISAASILFYTTGGGTIGSMPPGVVLMMATGTFPGPLLWVDRPYTGLFADLWGLNGSIGFGLIWIVASAFQVVAEYRLWNSLKKGAQLGVVLLAIGIFFGGVGFGAPSWPIVHSVQAILLVAGWKTLRPAT